MKRTSLIIALIAVFFGSISPGVVEGAAGRKTIAFERGAFTVSGTKLVRFGVGTRFVEKRVSGVGLCTARFFGRDPAPYVAKKCTVKKKKKKKSGGGSSSSSSSSSSTPTPTPDTSAPTAPMNALATAASSSRIDVSWSASTDNVGVSGYRIERCSGSGCTNFSQVGTPSASPHADTSLSSGTLYRYRVRAIDAASNYSSYSGITSATTSAGATVPGSPTGVSATASTGQATVVFSAPASNGGSSITNYTATSSPGSITASGSSSPIVVTGLSNGTSYTFTVTATNAIGTSSPSAASNSVTPAAGSAPAPLASSAPRILLNDSSVLTTLQNALNTSSTPATRFRDMVLGEIASPGSRYGFQAYFAALMYRLTGTASYGNYAVTKAMDFLADEEALINAGQRPTIAGDSYLEVGPFLGDLMLTYDWCYDLMDSSQRTRIINYANQTLFNVWNPDDATWGGVSYPWSGWSIDNPANNYYYSFLEATMLTGLATYGTNAQATAWLEKFYTDKIVGQLTPYFNAYLQGGGSREGTGYGTAMKNLFRLYVYWEKSTGVDIADLSTHAIRSSVWETHAIVPTLDFLSPSGDHARDSTAALYDYHREYLMALTYLYPTDQAARVGKTLLANSSVTEMAQSMNYWADFLYDLPSVTGLPLSTLNTSYYDDDTGNLFTRSSWSTNATYLHQIAGPYSESHAHRDQGSFVLWRGDWLFDDQNLRSQSGIEQDEPYHNLVRFMSGGNAVTMVEGAAETTVTALADNTNFTYSLVNTLPPYNGKSEVVKSQRELLFLKPGTVVVFDRAVSNSASVSRVFGLNMSTAPTINGSQLSLVKGSNRADVYRIAPAGVAWTTSNYGAGFSGGVRADASHSTGTESLFLHVIGTNSDVASVTSSDAAGQTGVAITFTDGRTATVRFSNSSTGGTLDFRTSGGAVLYNAALPTTVTTPAIYQ